jgi:hypothetical protein
MNPIEENIAESQKEINDIYEKFKRLQAGVNEVINRFNKIIGGQNNRIQAIEQELEEQKIRLRKHETERAVEQQRIERQIQDQQQLEQQRNERQIRDIVSEYNEWAKNPVSSLPVAFTYLEGDMRTRQEQSFKITARESIWITNKNGRPRCLFPNPRLFDQMTDLNDIYKMDMSKLRSKGSNRIRIITPCMMSDKGFISYGGELELL